MSVPGFTSVWNVPRHSPPRSFTAPTSVMAHELAEPPVVSRSTTTKVTSWSGAPSSSNDRCTKADGKGTCVRRQEHMFVVLAVSPTRPCTRSGCRVPPRSDNPTNRNGGAAVVAEKRDTRRIRGHPTGPHVREDSVVVAAGPDAAAVFALDRHAPRGHRGRRQVQRQQGTRL